VLAAHAHIRDGGARALAIFPPVRTPVLPDVPTMSESIAGLEVSTWSGVGVPSDTPADIIESAV
jgi:tripartite-type tricarboxylate transporter receptor subunit TctC